MSSVESGVKLALQVFYIVSMLVSIAMTSWLIDLLAESDDSSLAPDEFIRYVTIGLCAFWTLLEFFPTYQQRSSLIARVFPVHLMERWSINLVYDTITATTIGLLLGFCLMDALSNTYTHVHLINSLLFLANTIISAQVLKSFVDANHHKQLLLLILWLALVSVVILLISMQPPNALTLTGGLSLSLLSLLALSAYTDGSVIEAIRSTASIHTIFFLKQLSPVYLTFLTYSKSRNAFGLGLVLKMSALLLFRHAPGSTSVLNDGLLFLYVSPAILFTYVANNLWGFFPVLWINSTLGRRSDGYRIYFQLIGLPIVLDLIGTMLIVFYTGQVDEQLFLFYALSTLALSINGFIFSHNKAFYVQNSLNFGQMKNNVNGWSLLTAALVIGLTVLAIKSLVTIILFVIGLAVAIGYLYKQSLTSYAANTHTLYKQLFVDRT